MRCNEITLSMDFFDRDVLEVAQDLLGKVVQVRYQTFSYVFNLLK